ncbi:DNA primase [Hydrogenophaga sp. 5NK40-0174]|uniref:DNA primase n=1 Tax=Hydrogenophaga sp. 5NK40-0174 TaxID=3127649 RepID=UPI00310A0DB7
MAIPQTFIQDLLNRVDIVDVVGRYVQLKKGGANLMGLCPFHGEKSPSFSVSPSKQFYHCFGCGANGNAIGFLMEHTGMNFVEAVKELAQQTGMQVPEEEARPGDRERAAKAREKRASLTDLLAKAAKDYQKQLKDSPRAVSYLKQRGLTGAVAKAFGMGYAPEGWRHLAGVVPDYADARLVESGLVIEHVDEKNAEGESKRYDRFRDRIMFPIRNVKGETIGFGGRVLDKGEPKYLNSPETPVFSKGHELYGLFEARTPIRAAGYALVTEGYMDVVALAQLGFPQAVATLGTACTPDHVQKLFRFTDSVVFSFDGDAAGRRAARKALEAALPLATDTRSIRFLFLPAEHDPDSFIRANGAQAFEDMVQKATVLSRFLMEAASADCDLSTAEGRARMASQARPLWTALPDGALKRQLLGDLADQAGLDARDLEQLWAGQQRHDTGKRSAKSRWSPEGQAANGEGERQAGKYRKGKDWQTPGGSSKPYPYPSRREGQPRSAARAQRGVPSRADRAVGLLLANAQEWDALSPDDHTLLGHLPSPHGDVFAWLESQMMEHGPQPWSALREGLRGHAFEEMACKQVELATLGADTQAEQEELLGVMNLLREDAWAAQAAVLAERVAGGDSHALEEYKRIRDKITALKNGQAV